MSSCFIVINANWNRKSSITLLVRDISSNNDAFTLFFDNDQSCRLRSVVNFEFEDGEEKVTEVLLDYSVSLNITFDFSTKRVLFVAWTVNKYENNILDSIWLNLVKTYFSAFCLKNCFCCLGRNLFEKNWFSCQFFILSTLCCMNC